MGYTKKEWKVQDRTHVFAGDRLVANCGGFQLSQHEHETLLENEANAHLIAAAPRMVDTLLMVREELCFGGDWKTAKNKIDEVLSKAEGKWKTWAVTS